MITVASDRTTSRAGGESSAPESAGSSPGWGKTGRTVARSRRSQDGALMQSGERAAADPLVMSREELLDALAQSRRRNDELEGANADLRQFGYVVSHDLAEPLRTMSGFAGLLEADFGAQLGDRGAQYLALIRGGAERMQALIDDLGAYTRAGQQELTTAEVDLGQLVDEVVTSLSAHIAERAATVQHGGLPTVRGDRSMLGLVLQNLVTNGVKFNDSWQPMICIEARDVDDWIEVDVVD